LGCRCLRQRAGAGPWDPGSSAQAAELWLTLRSRAAPVVEDCGALLREDIALPPSPPSRRDICTRASAPLRGRDLRRGLRAMTRAARSAPAGAA
jgi:hypothetical protein